jgi:hypothetical protein
MIYANIHAEGHQNNSLFGAEDTVHLYNPTHTPRMLRAELLKHGIELNTPDINHGRNVAFDLYAEGQPLDAKTRPRFLVAMENPYINALNANRDYCRQFDKVFTWDLRLHDLPNVVPTMIPHPMQWANPPEVAQRDMFSCLINANKAFRKPLDVDLYLERINTIRWYERNAPDLFNLYGMGWDKPPPAYSLTGRMRRSLSRIQQKWFKQPAFPSYRGELRDKAEVLRQCRFSFCYENSLGPDNYITEKMFDSMVNGCIPIYWGADNVTNHIPTECFIDRRHFSSTKEVHQHLMSLTNSECQRYQDSIRSFLQSEKSMSFKTEAFVRLVAENAVETLKH